MTKEELIDKCMLAYSTIDEWIYGHSINDDHKDLDTPMEDILTLIKGVAVYLEVENKQNLDYPEGEQP